MTDQPGPMFGLRPRTWKVIGYFIGLALLIAAIVTAARQPQAMQAAIDTVRHTPPAQAARISSLILATALANLALTGLLFSVLMSRYGRVGLMEMQSLIAASTLLNFIPLRPGLFGRVAYHRMYNDIALWHSATVIAQAVVLSVASAGWLLISLALATRWAAPLWLFAAAPVPGLFVLAIAFSHPALAARFSAARLLMLAGAIRYLDLLVTAVRYHATFALIGSPIDARGALAFACLSAMATMVPFLSNGLGLREWAVGWLVPLLTPYQMSLGITADLINRAAEVLVAIVAGLIGLVILARLRIAHASRRTV